MAELFGSPGAGKAATGQGGDETEGAIPSAPLVASTWLHQHDIISADAGALTGPHFGTKAPRRALTVAPTWERRR